MTSLSSLANLAVASLSRRSGLPVQKFSSRGWGRADGVPHRAVACAAVIAVFSAPMPVCADGPDYGTDIRPILSQYCFKCHGPDETKRESDLRLDQREEALKVAGSGERPIVPGEPAASELVRRILSPDPDQQMPPPSTKLQLTSAQKETLKTWIAAGAEYKPHWSFVPPERPRTPQVNRTEWSRCGIDTFVLARLERERLAPSVEADRFALIRRVSLDLIGLPPTIQEADEFVGDISPDAYEKLVDRLMASPHYGERWARRWLDLARYADTNGYEKDRARSIWSYRDWVIRALNANMPFDQFTVEQLAGDMLPQATQDQRIATGFHRNTMLNEEGGIDPLEFRFYAMTDRVATTATVWMGLTLGCAQCHTHKYDPITHSDYYSVFGLLNNADEPEMDVVQPAIASQRQQLQQRIAELEADLPNKFPLPDEFVWSAIAPKRATSSGGATLTIQEGGSVLCSGPAPQTDVYQVEFDSDLSDVVAVRLESLADPSLPGKGPGRTPHGNFVLSEFSATVEPADGRMPSQAVKFVRAQADFSQDMFPIEKAIDGNAKAGGWAIHGSGDWNVDRSATFHLEKPISSDGRPLRWNVRLDQQFGTRHTIGKFRISLGRRRLHEGNETDLRTAHLKQKFQEWLSQASTQAVPWTLLKPTSATSNLPQLTILDDNSILSSGDITKRDLYDVTYELPESSLPITAIRIEAMPDARLPKNGPGRVYYEGPFGDFFLSEVSVKVNGQPAPLTGATQSFANGGNTAAMALDGNQQTGWSISGGQGKSQTAVFRLAQPVQAAGRLELSMLFERYYAAGLGRFRVWATTHQDSVEASSIPVALESNLLKIQQLSSQNQARDSSQLLADSPELLREFCRLSPDLSGERQKIETLRSQLPSYSTTLTFQERPASNPRPTYRHHRGEFLQPKERVQPAMLSALPPLPANEPANRLTFARWLVSSDNPLGARVTVNREWASLFGRGLVRTVEDFGSQGASPTHPELLDWLSVELAGSRQSDASIRHWDIKRLQRLMVTSATYRQRSQVTSELLAKDPQNEWLGRGPRSRLEAEILRDSALAASGLLSQKMGGASVFPPQPGSVTTEGTYGGLAWTTSPGEDRYRRTLYTYSKRTAPFAMSLTFDGPSGEACIARREVTNTPLQALTLLNDTVFVEAAQALGREFAGKETRGSVGDGSDRLGELFRRCLTRPATIEELDLLQRFDREQRRRLAANELDAQAIAGPGSADALERAAWTLMARALLNLDEAITRN